jgi:Ca2+-transporting ATPase
MEEGPSALRIFLEQFSNLFIIILIAAVVISAFIGHALEAQVILVIVLFAAILGFIQEYRAEQAIQALREMAAPTARVIREGREVEIPAREIVPGDLVLLGVGDIVPADLRLISAMSLKIDESTLTGESVPVEKDTAPLGDPEAPVAERRNLAYMGTVVVYGRGLGIAFATGMRTEFGRIAESLQRVEEVRTPLQRSLDDLGRKLAVAALVVVAGISALGVIREGQPLLEMFIWGVALAVAVVPEALAAIVVISLSVGVKRMVKRNALVRRLPAVETLGSTTYICTDKTGTLTQNKMVVRELYVESATLKVTGEGYEPAGEFLLEGEPLDPRSHTTLEELLKALALCNDAQLAHEAGEWSVKGDPTEGALLALAAKGGLDAQRLREEYPRIDEVPFSPERRLMTTIHRTQEGARAYTKGAPEVLVARCTRYRVGVEERPLDPQGRKAILEAAARMAGRALRVLAVAYRQLPSGYRKEEVEQELTFLGLVGMIDPPRPEAYEAVRLCREAGIRVVMITGDHRDTAMAVGRELGIIEKGRLLTGVELDRLDDEHLTREVEEIEAYARVSPNHKLRVVEALHRRGHVVAMTGDGVNDAPALKKADIGVAMGIAGTRVTKEVGDIVLLDDNFASIVAAVEEGRLVFDNIKKYLMYLLSSNIGEILLMALAVVLGLPLPLLAVQILYVNLATDGLPALALAFDPPDPDIMKQKPRDPRRSIFAGPVGRLMLVGGAWSALVNLTIFMWALGDGRSLDEARTLLFVTLILTEFFKAFNYRSEFKSIAQLGLLTNRWLVLAVLWECFLLLMIVYLPIIQPAFRTYSLPLEDWAIALTGAASIFPVLETAKYVIRRLKEQQH